MWRCFVGAKLTWENENGTVWTATPKPKLVNIPVEMRDLPPELLCTHSVWVGGSYGAVSLTWGRYNAIAWNQVICNGAGFTAIIYAGLI